MIQLTRLNGRPFVLNAEQIKLVEAVPDTMITLLNGDQLVVRESLREVVRRAVDYGRALRTFQHEPLADHSCAPAQHVPKEPENVS